MQSPQQSFPGLRLLSRRVAFPRPGCVCRRCVGKQGEPPARLILRPGLSSAGLVARSSHKLLGVVPWWAGLDPAGAGAALRIILVQSRASAECGKPVPAKVAHWVWQGESCYGRGLASGVGGWVEGGTCAGEHWARQVTLAW